MPLARNWRLLVAIFVFSLSLRSAAILATGASKIEFGDSQDYLNAAHIICTEHDYPSRGNLPFFRAPGLPGFISAVTACNTDRIAAVKLALAIVDSITALLVMGIGHQLSPNRMGPLIAGVLAAIHPGFVLQVTDIRSEPLFMALLTGALFSLILEMRKHRNVHLLIAGSLFSLAALTRPVALVTIPLAAFFLLSRRNVDFRARARAVILLVIAWLAPLLPWIGFMAAKHGELIVVNDAAGYNLWRGSHPDLYRALTAADRDEYRRKARHFELVTSPSAAAAVAAESDSPLSRSRSWMRRARENFVEQPRITVSFLLWKSLSYWRPWLNPLEHSAAAVIVSGAWWVPLFLCAFVGLLRIRNSWVFPLIVLWLMISWSSQIPFQVVTRFRVPFTDPLLIALSAHAISGAVKHIRSKKAPSEKSTHPKNDSCASTASLKLGAIAL